MFSLYCFYFALKYFTFQRNKKFICTRFFDEAKVQIQSEQKQISSVTKRQQRYKAHKQEGNKGNKNNIIN